MHIARVRNSQLGRLTLLTRATADSRGQDGHVVAQTPRAACQREPLELLDYQLGSCTRMLGEQSAQLAGDQLTPWSARVQQAICIEHERRAWLELKLEISHIGARANSKHRPPHIGAIS